MIELSVKIEIDGIFTEVGAITGKTHHDAVFAYSDEYLGNPISRPISLGLPLVKKVFDPASTRTFFEGLLPEGFIRQSVASALRAAPDDYITILKELGSECLGAIKITDTAKRPVKSDYRPLSLTAIKALAKEGATRSAALLVKAHLSLTGASGKVGLYYDEDSGKWYLPKGDAPSTHIVKQSHVRLENIVINEQLCLLTAGRLGIRTPDSFIVETGSNTDDNVLFATRRYDRLINSGTRIINGLRAPFRLHQEDFAQALGIPAVQKYEHAGGDYLKRMFNMIRSFSANPLEDQLALWKICVFNFLVGNTDNHIKNISVVYSSDLKTIRLAPAYDIISTRIYKNSSEDMSLGINGKYRIRTIGREDFEFEAKHVGLGRIVAMNIFDELNDGFVPMLREASEELADKGFDQASVLAKKIIKYSTK